MWIFLASIAVVALLGAFSELRPAFDGKPLSMVLVIQMFMLLSGALIIIITKTNPASISKNEVFRSGMIAIVAVYGIAWMAETMFGAHMTEIKGVLGEMVKEYPWAYAIVLLLVSKFVNSQAARWRRRSGGVGDRRRSGLHRRFRARLLRLLHSADLPKRSGGDSVRPLRYHAYRPLCD